MEKATGWKVTEFGLEHENPTYKIEAEKLAQIRVKGTKNIAAWPIHLAEKSWVDTDDLIEKFKVAINQFKPKNWQLLDLDESFHVAREISSRRSARS